MSCSNSCAHNGESVQVPEPQKRASRTVRQVIDAQIESARKHVESLCINKAKLEAVGVLDHPAELYNEIKDYF